MSIIVAKDGKEYPHTNFYFRHLHATGKAKTLESIKLDIDLTRKCRIDIWSTSIPEFLLSWSISHKMCTQFWRVFVAVISWVPSELHIILSYLTNRYLGQSNDCLSVSDATLRDMSKSTGTEAQQNTKREQEEISWNSYLFLHIARDSLRETYIVFCFIFA